MLPDAQRACPSRPARLPQSLIQRAHARPMRQRLQRPTLQPCQTPHLDRSRPRHRRRLSLLPCLSPHLGVVYPVAIDNDFDNWDRYRNRYWPARYRVDTRGVIRFRHIGEGAYAETHAWIERLLGGASSDDGFQITNSRLQIDDRLAQSAICNLQSAIWNLESGIWNQLSQPRNRTARSGYRQRKPRRRALTGRAVDADFAAMGLNQAARDDETQPHAAVVRAAA